MDKYMKKNRFRILKYFLLSLICIVSMSMTACSSEEPETEPTEEEMEAWDREQMQEVIELMEDERYEEAREKLKLVSESTYPEVWALKNYAEIKDAEQRGITSGARADILAIYIPDDYNGVMRKELLEYRDYYIEKYKPKEEEKETSDKETADEGKKYHGGGGAVVGGGPDFSEFEEDDDWDETPSKPAKPSKPNKKEPPYDPYDVYDYSDPEDFYYDNYDDFWDYEDAEDYYYEAWEKYEK